MHSESFAYVCAGFPGRRPGKAAADRIAETAETYRELINPPPASASRQWAKRARSPWAPWVWSVKGAGAGSLRAANQSDQPPSDRSKNK